MLTQEQIDAMIEYLRRLINCLDMEMLHSSSSNPAYYASVDAEQAKIAELMYELERM